MDLRALQSDPSAFRAALLIDCDGEAKPLASVLDDWQRADFERLDPSWRVVAGQTPYSTTQFRAWLERPRGHGKTQDISVMATWALFASVKQVSGLAYAADRDQARLLRDCIQRLIRMNDWLSAVLDVQQYAIVNRHTGSRLDIESSDVGSSYGTTPHFLILDEICHWSPNAEDLWSSLMSSAAKRAYCLLVAIGNAGFSDSWQFRLRERVRESQWYFSRLDGPRASWITEDRLAEQRDLLPGIAYSRLWENQWSSGSGDAIPEADIDAAFSRDVDRHTRARPGWAYAGGLDLSVSRDHSAFAIVGRDTQGRYALAQWWVWRPTKASKIDQEQIEQTIREAHKLYRLCKVAADPYQAEFLCQRLSKQGVRIETRPQTGKSLLEQGSFLLEAFTSGNLDLPRDGRLRRELERLRVEEKSYGWRLAIDRTSEGHGDLVSAMSIALVVARGARARTYKLDWAGIEQAEKQFSERLQSISGFYR